MMSGLPSAREPRALACGYVDDARRLEADGRGWAMTGGSECLPEAVDDTVCANAMWTLAALWMLAWLLSEHEDD